MDAPRLSAPKACSPKRRGRLKAATLLESVLAMGLLAAIMSLAVLMHARTLTSARAGMRMQAWSATEAALVAVAEGASLDRTWEAPPGMALAVEGTAIVPGLRSLRLVCTNGNGVLLERRVILPAP